jgi:ribosome-associated translation inhibitor RaiA
MRIAIASPGIDLTENETREIERDLDKVARRLVKEPDVTCEVRVNNGQPAGTYRVVIELHYRTNRLVATSDAPDAGFAVREAREDLLRQINDRAPRGHSSHAKH